MPQIRTPFGLGLYGGFDPASKDTWAGTPLVLEEVTGAKRRLELKAQALPSGTIDLPLKRVARVTRYQGQQAATTHVLSVDQGSTTLSGRWLSRELAADDLALWRPIEIGPLQRIGSAEDLREAVYALVRDGQELRVEWAGVQRYTAALEFTPRHYTRGDIAWDLTVEWGAAGEFVPLSMVDTAEDAAFSLFDTVADLVDLAAYPAEVAHDLIDYVDTQIGRVEGLVSEIRDTVNLYTTSVTRLAQVAGRAVGLFDRLKAAAKDIRDTARSTSAAAAWTGASSGTAGLSEAVKRRIALWLLSMGRAAGKTAAQAEAAKAVYLAALNPSVDKVITVVGDTDLRMVAQQQWGDPTLWTMIADANILDGSAVSAGTQLIIPSRSTTAVAA